MFLKRNLKILRETAQSPIRRRSVFAMSKIDMPQLGYKKSFPPIISWISYFRDIVLESPFRTVPAEARSTCGQICDGQLKTQYFGNFACRDSENRQLREFPETFPKLSSCNYWKQQAAAIHRRQIASCDVTSIPPTTDSEASPTLAFNIFLFFTRWIYTVKNP